MPTCLIRALARRVLVTGDTGFKELARPWLAQLGAEVTAVRSPSGGLAVRARRRARRAGRRALRRRPRRRRAARAACDRAEVVLHLAAQAIVRRSLADPVADVGGQRRRHGQPAARVRTASGAVLVVTSDKCYRDVAAGRRCARTTRSAAATPTARPRRRRSSSPRRSARRSGARRGRHRARRQRDRRRRLGATVVPDVVRAAAGAPVAAQPDRDPAWQHVLSRSRTSSCRALLAGEAPRPGTSARRRRRASVPGSSTTAERGPTLRFASNATSSSAGGGRVRIDSAGARAPELALRWASAAVDASGRTPARRAGHAEPDRGLLGLDQASVRPRRIA